MRHVPLIVVISLTSAIAASAGILGDKIYIRESGGGSNGYAEKIETHDPGFFYDEHHLTCLNSGNTRCTWTIKPSGSIIGWAKDSVSAGNLADTIMYTHPNGDVSTLIWEGIDENNYEAHELLEYASGLD